MANLLARQITIKELFEKSFIIPEYQRPYSWTVNQCETLWDDLYEFIFPDGNADNFDENSEYYLGSIVTFSNKENEKDKEVIDGQQRLTTLTLLLRVFWDKFLDPENENKRLKEMIGNCIWQVNRYGDTQTDLLRISSKVADNEDRISFNNILLSGVITDDKSNYAQNYQFFQKKISELSQNGTEKIKSFPAALLHNCAVIYIEAAKQEDALRIFSTLNDRGLPLSDTDIFKAEMYKYVENKTAFVEKWKELEEKSKDCFTSANNPMDELFTNYMYFLRAKEGNVKTTTIALRKYFEKDKYSALKKDDTLDDLEVLVDFWNKVNGLHEDFSDEVRKRLYVLKYAPNRMWTNFASVYYMHNRDNFFENKQDDFKEFLDKSIAFFWGAVVNGTSLGSIKNPIFKAMKDIVDDNEITLTEFSEEGIKSSLEYYDFRNGRPITKAMLTWWAVIENGENLDLRKEYDIEHIYAKKLYDDIGGLKDKKTLELLGNKSLLEKRINVRVSDNWFEVKCTMKNGYNASVIKEMQEMANVYGKRFEEKDILSRNEEIHNAFLKFLKTNGILFE